MARRNLLSSEQRIRLFSIPTDPAEMARAFYYDTILYDRHALRFLAESVGADHIVVGSDYPFSIKQDRPAEFAELALGINRATLTENAARFLNRAPFAA